MTKAENRAAAKACNKEWDRQRREAAHAEAAQADLDELRRLRDYLIFRRRALGADRDALMCAIDDYVEQPTGDRTALHARSSPIGWVLIRDLSRAISGSASQVWVGSTASAV
jgi:hypothetical protein